MKRTPAGLVFAVGLGLLSPLASAQAQTPPAAPSADDAAMAAQKAAFMGCRKRRARLPRRRSSGLGFTLASTTATSASERATRSLPFRRASKRPPMGRCPRLSSRPCSPPLKRPARRLGFQVVSDPKTGAKIGAPLKLLRALPGARLDFAANADADLGALYARLSAATPPARSPIRRSSQTPSLSSPGRTDRSSSIPASTRTRMRPRQSAASPSPIRRRRPPISTELRSPSPIHSSRSPNPPQRQAPAPRPIPPRRPRRARLRLRLFRSLPRPRLSWRPARR